MGVFRAKYRLEAQGNYHQSVFRVQGCENPKVTLVLVIHMVCHNCGFMGLFRAWCEESLYVGVLKSTDFFACEIPMSGGT